VRSSTQRSAAPKPVLARANDTESGGRRTLTAPL